MTAATRARGFIVNPPSPSLELDTATAPIGGPQPMLPADVEKNPEAACRVSGKARRLRLFPLPFPGKIGKIGKIGQVS